MADQRMHRILKETGKKVRRYLIVLLFCGLAVSWAVKSIAKMASAGGGLGSIRMAPFQVDLTGPGNAQIPLDNELNVTDVADLYGEDELFEKGVFVRELLITNRSGVEIEVSASVTDITGQEGLFLWCLLDGDLADCRKALQECIGAAQDFHQLKESVQQANERFERENKYRCGPGESVQIALVLWAQDPFSGQWPVGEIIPWNGSVTQNTEVTVAVSAAQVVEQEV